MPWRQRESFRATRLHVETARGDSRVLVSTTVVGCRPTDVRVQGRPGVGAHWGWPCSQMNAGADPVGPAHTLDSGEQGRTVVGFVTTCD